MKIFWDISYNCNGQCIYCFTNSSSRNFNIADKELKGVYLFLEEINADKVSIGGGEPLINDFNRICDFIPDRVQISVTTNGTIWDEEIVKKIKDRNIKVTISLDSLKNEYYRTVRRGLCIDKIVNTIEKFSKIEEIRHNLSLRTTLNTSNFNEIPEIIDFCLKNQIHNLKVNTTNLFGRAKSNSDLVVDFELFQKKLKEIKNYAENYREKINIELPIKKYLTDNTQKCTLGKESLYLDPYGNVFPCAFSEGELSFGNIYVDNMKKVSVKIKEFSYENIRCNKCPIHRYEKN